MDAIVSRKLPEYRLSLRPAAALYKYAAGSTPKEGKKLKEKGGEKRKKKKITNKQKKDKKFMELFSNKMKRNPALTTHTHTHKIEH